MLLSLLGGMAKRGMQLNDERRAIEQQIELTKKLEDIKDEYAQRRAARASAAKERANAKKYMGMLMPLVGGDEELARKIFSQYQEGTGDIVANGMALQAMGIPFIKDGTLNPIINLPDVDAQSAVYQNLAINGTPEQQEGAKNWLGQLEAIQSLGEKNNITPSLSNAIDTSLKNVISAAANANPSIDGNKVKVRLTPDGLVTSDDPNFSRWLVEVVKPQMEVRLREFFPTQGPAFLSMYTQPYMPVSLSPIDYDDDFEDDLKVTP